MKGKYRGESVKRVSVKRESVKRQWFNTRASQIKQEFEGEDSDFKWADG